MIKILKKTEPFPAPADSITGDLLVLQVTSDLFVFDGVKWVLIGGQYLPPNTRTRVYEYLHGGWDSSDILKQDLLNYLRLDDFWQHTFYKRALKLADEITSKLENNSV
jgi:hypothetical protein